jgi:hypothetical protein
MVPPVYKLPLLCHLPTTFMPIYYGCPFLHAFYNFVHIHYHPVAVKCMYMLCWSRNSPLL